MNRKKSSRLRFLLHGVVACMCIGLLTGCNEPDTTRKSTVVQTTDTTALTYNRGISEMGLTLPVLDALFFEEGFEQELKSKLLITEAQIDKLKTVSRESVADLSEEGAYAGSARGAAKRSGEQIREILGVEKADQLFQLVSQRFAGGEVEGLLPTTPNAIPTDTRIVVNAPAYRMDVFQDGRLVKSYRIGIGYPEFPLPTGMRRAETIIFNPTWTPPDEPWVKGKYKPGEKVEAGSKLNPLGPIKIPIGSPSLIHGGKAVAKLGTFASHGCVGMTNEQVRDFAVALSELSGSSLTAEEVGNYGKQKTETKSVKLARTIPVELRYETIVAENGALRIFRDVYERGTNTVDAAVQVLDVHGVSYESLSVPEKKALLQALAEMNRDPQGVPIVENIGAAPDTASGIEGDLDPSPGSNNGVAASKLERAKKGKETKTIVGRKEVAVPIAGLNGKGYPVPVNFTTGEKPATSTGKRKGV